MPPLSIRSKNAPSPTLHRLCTDFGTEDQRRKSGGRTEEKRRNSEPAFDLKRKKWLFFLGYSKYLITFA